ncbi:MAG TPA: succinate dehydrogenase assembly factor 2 [Steroidobacteraceae bacterium]|nr:succinate dehydrogenase assembly factor 2 [Steroidobacteraceae bacterium]
MAKASSDPTDGAASSTSGAPFSDVARERLGVLEWRCRRGMKELDLLLVRYLRKCHASASSDERDTFAQFLELPDPEIARYLVWGDVPQDPNQAALCRRILQPD